MGALKTVLRNTHTYGSVSFSTSYLATCTEQKAGLQTDLLNPDLHPLVALGSAPDFDDYALIDLRLEPVPAHIPKYYVNPHSHRTRDRVEWRRNQICLIFGSFDVRSSQEYIDDVGLPNILVPNPNVVQSAYLWSCFTQFPRHDMGANIISSEY